MDIWFKFELSRQILAALLIVAFVGYGIDVVMASLVVLNAAAVPFFFLIARKLINISLKVYLEAVLMPLMATAVMCITIVALPEMLPPMQPWLVLAAQIAVGAVVYAAVVLSLSGRQIAELRQTFARGATGE